MPTYRLNTLVEVVQDVSGSTDFDWKEEQLDRVAWAWADIKPTRALEQTTGQQVEDVLLDKVVMRYDKRIKPGMKLRRTATGELWDIHGVVDIDYRHEYLELSVSEKIDAK